SQNYSDAVKPTEKPHGMEAVEAVEGAEEAPSPRQDYAWTSKKHKQGDSLAPKKSSAKRLFYKAFGDVDAEEEPAPREREAEQGLNPNQRFFYDLLVANSPSAASSVLEDVAEEEGSSRGGHLPALPQTTDTHWRPLGEGSVFLHKPGSSDSPDSALVQGDLFETKLGHHLRLLVPDEALRTFMAHVARALRTDCSLPELRPACAKLLAKTGLLVELLSEDRGASALAGRCLPEGSASNETAMGREVSRGPVGRDTGHRGTRPSGQPSLLSGFSLLSQEEPEHSSGDRLLLALAVSVIIMINLTVICLVEVRSQKSAAASQRRSTSKLRPRW
ncbi:LR37B protein, partial [Bucorvus abyssinicus]|nr:LR37B protein [Bucorvus abyssinicus]